jgi:NAD(P)H-hydrate epimerase
LGGDPEIARAGTGEVLTEMIKSLSSQKMNLYNFAVLAVCMHFKAAELAANKKTSYSMLATDVIKCLPEAFKFYLEMS